MEKQTVSVMEAAAALDIKSKDAAYKAAANGEIPAIRIGRLWRVPKAALEKLLAEGRPKPKAA